MITVGQTRLKLFAIGTNSAIPNVRGETAAQRLHLLSFLRGHGLMHQHGQELDVKDRV